MLLHAGPHSGAVRQVVTTGVTSHQFILVHQYSLLGRLCPMSLRFAREQAPDSALPFEMTRRGAIGTRCSGTGLVADPDFAPP